MVTVGMRHLWATLIFAIGLVASGLLPASANVPEALAAIKPAEVCKGLYYSRLTDLEVYILASENGTSANLILVPKLNLKDRAAMLQQLERFLSVYKLANAKTTLAEDGGAAFVSMGTPDSRKDVLEMLTSPSVADAYTWLCATLRGNPQRVEGSRLTWVVTKSKFTSTGLGSRSYTSKVEITLDLLAGAPCYLDLHVANEAHESASEQIGNILSIQLENSPRNKTNVLRRQFGCTAVSFIGRRMNLNGKRKMVAAYLVASNQRSGSYRLGSTDLLKSIKNSGVPHSELPQVETLAWADESPQNDTPAPEPQGVAWGESAESETTPEPAAEPALAEQSSPPAVHMPTPEEARLEYALRLKSL